MRAIWAAAFMLRRLRSDAGVALMVFGLVAVTAFLFAAAPRLFNSISDAGLRHELREARSVERNLQISVIGPASSRGLERVETEGEEFQRLMPESITSLLVDRAVSIESIRFAVTDAPDRRFQTTFINLRYQDGLENAIELVSGHMPGSHGIPLPPPNYGFINEDPEPPDLLPRFDIALSDAIAEASGLNLGDIIEVSADGSDPMLPRAFA